MNEAARDPNAVDWSNDLLSYREVGESFSSLVSSITDSRVISIEAGFGRGKTFFRRRWAKDLCARGECVIEIDAQASDHSGDPLITFVGALVAAVPEKEGARRAQALEAGKKIAGVVGRTLLRAVFREGADELISLGTGEALENSGGGKAVEAAIDGVSKGLSDLAGQMIDTQLATERVRIKELPDQIVALRDTLIAETGQKRVVVLVDELDCCHPEYALRFLEAMKLVFNTDGFVFCLLVNADYLESLAAHRFGIASRGESYLEKFLDIRLRLPDPKDHIGNAAKGLAMKLPLGVPFGPDEHFGLAPAAELAAVLAPASGLSMRQIERVFLKIEMALRRYKETPIDCPLIMALAFQEGLRNQESDSYKQFSRIVEASLPRRKFTVEAHKKHNTAIEAENKNTFQSEMRAAGAWIRFVDENFPALNTLNDSVMDLSPEEQKFVRWAKHLALAKTYIPRHEAMLNAVQRLMAAGTT